MQMRALTLAATVVVVSATGSAACGVPIPFHVARRARVTLPMGPVDPQCTKVSGDCTLGDVTVQTSKHVAGLVNKAWHEESNVNGDGSCDVQQAIDEIDALSAAAAPAMVLDCTLTMTGITHASLGG